MTDMITACGNGPWVVEIDTGAVNWVPIAQSSSRSQAERLAKAPHVVGFGKPVRVRELWHAAPPVS